jgi:hypothetical protein
VETRSKAQSPEGQSIEILTAAFRGPIACYPALPPTQTPQKNRDFSRHVPEKYNVTFSLPFSNLRKGWREIDPERGRFILKKLFSKNPLISSPGMVVFSKSST